MKFVLKILVLFLLLTGVALANELRGVSEDEIIKAIRAEFVEEGLGEDVDLELFGGQTGFQIGVNQSVKILVSSLELVEINGRFSCDVEVFADGKSAGESQVVGKYYEMTDVAVPSKNINKGEEITADKLGLVRMKKNKVKEGNIIDAEKLIGQEAKRFLKVGKVVGDKDVGLRPLVRKGEMTTVSYKTDKMQITAKAQALSDGAKGEVIELMNLKSKKILNGRVIDENTVEVDTGF